MQFIGQWSTSGTYGLGNVVYYQGDSWGNLFPAFPGDQPPPLNPTSWSLVATKGINGLSGSSGTSGSSGRTGTAGTSGTSSAGSPGTAGTSGTSASGTPGSSGTSGVNGGPGTSGTSGNSITVSNNTNNYVTTATGGFNINGESNLQFDGTTLTISNNLGIASASGNLSLAGPTIDTGGAITHKMPIVINGITYYMLLQEATPSYSYTQFIQINVTSIGYIKYYKQGVGTVYYFVPILGNFFISDCAAVSTVAPGIPFAQVANFTIVNSGIACTGSNYRQSVSINVTDTGYIKYDKYGVGTVLEFVSSTGNQTLVDCLDPATLEYGYPTSNPATFTINNYGVTCGGSPPPPPSGDVISVGGYMQPCIGGTIDDFMGASVTINTTYESDSTFGVYVYWTSPGAGCASPSSQYFEVTIPAGQYSSNFDACLNGAYFPSGADICGGCIISCDNPAIDLTGHTC